MDACLQLLARASQRPEWHWSQVALRYWLKRLYIHAETPQGALETAVQRELADLRERAVCDLLQGPDEDGREGLPERCSVVRQAELLLLSAQDACSFPRDGFEGLAQGAAAHPNLARKLRYWAQAHRALEQRLRWLVEPELTRQQLQTLDPRADAQQLWCFVKYDFRAEFMHAAWANAIKRIAQDAPASTLIRATKKAELRPLLRTENTLYYHYFVMNWGVDSYHGRTAIAGLNALHERFHIPQEAMKFVCLDSAFTVLDSLDVLGHRKPTDTERRGYFHASVELGQAMHVDGLSHDFDAMYNWFRAYNRERSSYAPLKRALWDSISDSFDRSVRIPIPIAKGRRALEVIAMDEDLRAALGFRTPSRFATQLGRGVLKGLALARRWLPHEPYVESLQPSLSYPNGVGIAELVGQPETERETGRCPFSGQPLPVARVPGAVLGVQSDEAALFTWDEISRQDLWVVIGDEVFDLSAFAESHPGGLAVLAAGAGTDMTEQFNLAPHSAQTRVFMLNFRIGRVAKAEAPVPACQ
ncbi:MAG: hypothetical protein RJA70_3946 [Pseudomonadota bacterium]